MPHISASGPYCRLKTRNISMSKCVGGVSFQGMPLGVAAWTKIIEGVILGGLDWSVLNPQYFLRTLAEVQRKAFRSVRTSSSGSFQVPGLHFHSSG